MIGKVKKRTRACPFYFVGWGYTLPDFTASKSSSISREGFLVRRDTTTMRRVENMKAGSSSYIANTPPSLLITSFQRNTMPAPPTMLAIAPALVVLFQKREKSMMGPKVAPKPAQAKETILKITLSLSSAMTAAITAITQRVILETHITCLSVAFFLNTPWNMFLETEDAAISK